MKQDAYFYKGLSGKDFNRSLEENRKITAQQKAFNDELNAILNTEEEKRIEALRNFTNSPIFQRADSNQIMSVYVAFRDEGSFEDMINLYHQVDNEDFKRAPMVREFLSVAYNKVGNPGKAIAVASDLKNELKANGDVYGSMGKAYLMKYKEAKKKGATEEEQRNWLKLSAGAYEKGFMEYMEFYPGINAVYRQIDLGDIDKARKMAQIVYLSCEKEGASETKDYWCATSKLEASCIAGVNEEQIEKSLQELMAYNVPAWQFETTRDTLRGVNEKINSPMISKIIERIDSKLKNKEAPSVENTNHEQQVSIIDSLIRNSYSYRGLASNFEGSNTVNGNFKRGGQLPDHAVSRKDIALFTALLNEPFENLFPPGECPIHLEHAKKFNDIKDPREFLQTVDSFIRYHYGTENFIHSGLHLEDNAEIQNSVYDGAVNTIIELSGKEKNASSDSKTNISALFALGVGDCRHHANVKQIMFDTWQEKQIDECLKKACTQLIAGDPHYEQTIDQFYKLQNTELRTFDLNVEMPIEVNGIYDPKRSENGKYIRADHTNRLESHTLNMLLIKDRGGNLQDLVICDAFYQNQYDWKEHRVNPEDIQVDESGKFRLPGGVVKPEKVDSNEALPITLRPTSYAGRKDRMTKADTGDNISLLGIELNNLRNPKEFIKYLQNRSNIEERLRKLLVANNKPAKHTSKAKVSPQQALAKSGRD